MNQKSKVSCFNCFHFRNIWALLLTVSFLFGTVASAELVERIVAIVNDDIITQSDMDKYEQRLKSGGLVDDMLVPDEATKVALTKDREKLLQKLIEERLLDSEVKKQGLTVPIERVESEIRSIAKKNGVSRDELKVALQERAIAFSQYQDFIKTGLERQSLIEKAITQKIKISEDDVMSAYTSAHGASTDQAFEYTLAHILFLSEKGGTKGTKSSKSAADAQERAEKVYKKLRDGADFERVAADASEDPGFEPGGVLGVFKTGELHKDLESVASKLNAGEFSSVLPTNGGFHIVKLIKKKIISDPRTEKERDKIRAQIYEAAYKKQFHSWLEQLRQDAFVRINLK
jgi:peptidyl-prolyl cis-trans isomerase SurA